MDTLTQAEQSVASLSERELASFREWFYKFDNQVWDEKLVSDIEYGKLDKIASEALKDFVSGKAKEI
jgi:hypothetical protein